MESKINFNIFGVLNPNLLKFFKPALSGGQNRALKKESKFEKV